MSSSCEATQRWLGVVLALVEPKQDAVQERTERAERDVASTLAQIGADFTRTSSSTLAAHRLSKALPETFCCFQQLKKKTRTQSGNNMQ